MTSRFVCGKIVGRFAMGCFLILFLVGCRAHVPPPEEKMEPFSFKRLLVLPFRDMAQIYGENVMVQCRLCGNVITTGKVAQGADGILTGHLMGLLEKRKSLELIPFGQAEGVYSTILSGASKELPERELLVQIGQTLKADAVLSGKVFRYAERDGTGYSVRSAASVAFDLDLIRISDGRTVWSGHFDETQQSLFENLFHLSTFINRKARWVTAEELAIEGLHKTMDTFPAP